MDAHARTVLSNVTSHFTAGQPSPRGNRSALKKVETSNAAHDTQRRSSSSSSGSGGKSRRRSSNSRRTSSVDPTVTLTSSASTASKRNRRHTADMSEFNNLLADLEDIGGEEDANDRLSSVSRSRRTSSGSRASSVNSTGSSRRRRDTLDLMGDMTSYSNTSMLSSKRRKRRDTLDMLGIDDSDASDDGVDEDDKEEEEEEEEEEELEVSFNPNSSMVSSKHSPLSDRGHSPLSDRGNTFDLLNGSDESSFDLNGRRNTMDMLDFDAGNDVDSPGGSGGEEGAETRDGDSSTSSEMSQLKEDHSSDGNTTQDSAATASPAAFAALFGDESVTSPPASQHIVVEKISSGLGLPMEKSALRAPPLKSAMKKKSTNARTDDDTHASHKTSTSAAPVATFSESMAGRTVVFGSPAVAEFDLKMPPTSMRKLPAQDAKRMFSMDPAPAADSSESDDEVTANNDSVLAALDKFDSDSDNDDMEEEEHGAVTSWSSARRRRSSRAGSTSSTSSSSALRRSRSARDHEDNQQRMLEDSVVDDSDTDSSDDDDMSDVADVVSPNRLDLHAAHGGPRSEVPQWVQESDGGAAMSSSNTDSSSGDDDSDADMSMTMQHDGISAALQGRQTNTSGTKRSNSGPSSDDRSYDNSNSNNKRMRVETEDRTVDLETLGELLSVNMPASTNKSLNRSEDQDQNTVQLEGGLGNLLDEFGDDSNSKQGSMQGDGSNSSSSSSSSSSSDESDDDDFQSDMERDQQTGTIELEGGMVSLIANMSRDAKQFEVDEEDHTIELEHGLGSLLAGMSPASSHNGVATSHNGVATSSGGASLDVTSPSTPGPSSAQQFSAPAADIPAVSTRKTPTPPIVTLESVAQTLQLGNALDLEALDHEQLDILVSEFSAITSELTGEDMDVLLQRRESIVKVAVLLKDRCLGLHKKLSSGTLRIGLQKLRSLLFSTTLQEEREDMTRSVALFMAVAREEARVDWAVQTTESERVSLEKLAHSSAVLEFDENTIKAHNQEILDLTHAATQESESLEKVVTLHAELQEQEQVLAMFAKQREEATASRNQYELTLKSLREEGTRLRNSIDSQKAVSIEKEGLMSRTKVLEEIHDVCRSLCAWKLSKMSASRVELVYEHQNGSSHVIQLQFAAKAPSIICELTFNPSTTSNASNNSEHFDFFKRLTASLDPVWNKLVQEATSLPALQHAMQSIDVEIGRMQALDRDLSAVASRFVIPKGIQIHSVGGGANSNNICSFTVHFSCLEPASKWNVGFDVLRGYPFGRVNIVPEAEFGNSPANVADICDVAFGYTRLERACEYLAKTFFTSCAANQKS